MKRYIFLFVLVAFVSLIAYAWGLMNFITSPASEDKQTVVFEVPSGVTFDQIAKDLYKDKLITDVFKFKIVSRIAKVSNKIKAGEYELHTRMSPLKILQILSAGKSLEYPITFQEGINMYEMADIFQKKGLGERNEFLSLCKDKQFIVELLGRDIGSLEGYLFPETYFLTKNTKARSFIKTMVKRFKSVYEIVNQSARIKMPIHRHVTLASLIEKETGAPEERPIISSVFHNRLRMKMKLQSDPTILYGILDQAGVMPKNIRREDIKTYTKYNTYTVAALPYGPIANPGQKALESAVNPDSTDYLYFVSRNNGTHAFSRTLKEHNNAVRKWQLNRKNRQGKSWRDLSKESSQ